MPFYQFGDAIYLSIIETKNWIPFICQKFQKQNLIISEDLAKKICIEVENYSSYVQQLAWNVMLNTNREVAEEIIEKAMNELIAQNSALFMQQTEGLSSFQMNMLRAIASDIHNGFTTKKVLAEYNLGTKSNISRIQKTLIDRDLVELREEGLFINDPVFKKWFRRFCC